MKLRARGKLERDVIAIRGVKRVYDEEDNKKKGRNDAKRWALESSPLEV